jgi:hypothetical protein
VAGIRAAARSARRRAAASVLALAVATALTGGAGGAAAAPEPDLIAFARAFNAAWNAHDVEGVVALFAPDATVRQTRARVADAGDGVVAAPVIEDVYGAGPRPLADAHDQGTGAWGEVLWAAGPAEVRAWLPRFFAAGHRVEAAAYRAEADVVTWRFRAFADPYQRGGGVDPAEGTANLVVRAGRAVSFVFESEGETVARRARQFDAAQSARLAAAWAAFRPPAGPSPGGPAAPPGAFLVALDGPDPRLLLGLLGTAALAGLLARWRRHPRCKSGTTLPGRHGDQRRLARGRDRVVGPRGAPAVGPTQEASLPGCPRQPGSSR